MKQITPNERALPLYQAGLSAGQDIGLAFALTALTAERGRLARLADRGYSPHAPDMHRISFADGTLLAVSKTLGARFRQ